MWLTRLALRNPVLIFMMSLMAIALGWISLRGLPVDLFPNIELPVVRVTTFYPGAGPSDIEKTVTQPTPRMRSMTLCSSRMSSTCQSSSVSMFFDKSPRS